MDDQGIPADRRHRRPWAPPHANDRPGSSGGYGGQGPAADTTRLLVPNPGAGPVNGLPRLYGIAETASSLGLSESTIRRAIRLRQLAAIRVGRAVRLAESDVATWLERGRRKPR